MQDKVNEVIEQLLDKATRGDLPSAKLALDYYTAHGKERTTYNLPQCQTSSDVVKAYGSIVQMLSDGKLNIDEAHKMGSLLNMQVRAIEVHEQEEEILKLNERLLK